MKDYGIEYTLVREDGRLERVCEHGIGHTVGHTRGYLMGSYETIHGCDGCCRSYETQRIRGRTYLAEKQK
jgi:hypothetical protein